MRARRERERESESESESESKSESKSEGGNLRAVAVNEGRRGLHSGEGHEA